MIEKIPRRFRGLVTLPKVDNRTNVVATLLVVLSGIFISLLIANAQSSSFDKRVNDFESRLLLQFQNTLSERLSSYEQTLLSARTLFAIDNDVTRADWKGFYDGQEINRRLPGTLGVGFAEYVPDNKKTDYIQRVRDEGFLDFTVTPSDTAEALVPVTYVEPFNDVTRPTLGYDMFSDSSRRDAMRRALRNNGLAMTEPVDLIRGDTERGVILFLPVYNQILTSDSDTSTVTPEGFVYAVVDIDNLMTQLFGEANLRDNRFAVRISDVSIDSSNTIYESSGLDDIASKSGADNVSLDFNIIDRLWRLEIVIDKGALISSSVTPAGIAVTGVALSILIGSFIYTAMINRLKFVQSLHESELQRTKDELLALASHQLRTPATAVKQYVGMMLYGYTGKITKEQKIMLTKAYNSNDRQIEIINHLLYVAKADAGELKMEPEDFNLTKLTREVVEDSKPQTEKKHIEIEYHSRKKVFVSADQKFIRMIIENLVSNAIKYSENHSKITVKAFADNNKAIVTVSDSGVGIKAADLKRLFQKFSRIENKFSRSEGGSGIGLYLAKRLADAHNGSLTVHTAEGEGSTFTLTLPLRRGKKAKVRKGVKKHGKKA